MLRPSWLLAIVSAMLFSSISPALAAAPAAPVATPPSYADLADLAEAAPLVARVQVRNAIRLKPEQAPGLAPGMARVLIKARTRAVLTGAALGESISYLADVPLDAKGKLPKLAKREALIFARTVPARPGELQLVASDAQLAWDPALEGRLRAILTELVAPGAPPRVTGVREALYVPGNLVGEGETQIFLATATGDPVSLTVVRRPDQPAAWGVAFGEIVDQAARPPRRDTLAWYRLACFLPASLPPSANIGDDASGRRRAAEDYRWVRSELGSCPRTRVRR